MAANITKIIGIYHADSGVVGHLRYAFDKVARGDGCTLCDISHGLLREKTDFDACKKSLGIPMEMIYRNQLPPPLARHLGGQTPAVVGALSTGAYRTLLGPPALAEAEGDVFAFRTALEAALATAPDAED